MPEYVGNLHIHTPYSDGTDYHSEIAAAAERAGIDFIVVTDHNIIVKGVEGYYGEKPVLVLTGEEIHDRYRLPQVNHCLVYNIPHEMTCHAHTPQTLLDEVKAAKGLSFLAHPYDPQIPWQNPDGDGISIPWVDWHVQGFNGLEIWNYMSEWKATLPNLRKTVRSVLNPEDTMIAPQQATLDHWDRLLAAGQHVVGIGNADAHGTYVHLGAITRRIFPYDFLFRCVNTHVITSEPFNGNIAHDAQLIYTALGEGRAFIGYDLPGDTRGFRFTAQGEFGTGSMGDTLQLGAGVTLQTLAPGRGRIRIIRHGEVVTESANAEALTFPARETGAYRVEVWKEYRGIERCWILSNPIYIVL